MKPYVKKLWKVKFGVVVFLKHPFSLLEVIVSRCAVGRAPEQERELRLF